MLEELVCGLWLALGAYAFWFMFKAKEFHPLTLDDLALTWKLHKRQAGCKASCIHDLLVRNEEVVGFKCECGHEYVQKRLITQRPSIFAETGRLAARALFQNTSGTMENLGLVYVNIKKI
jgi:hypothetical protein